ncbi:MAG: hypothetical protein NXI35_32765 [bacterium]|nr:hypothetical protein [bacterium]
MNAESERKRDKSVVMDRKEGEGFWAALGALLGFVHEYARTATFAEGFGALGGGIVAFVVAPVVSLEWMLLAAGAFLVCARIGQLLDRAVGPA